MNFLNYFFNMKNNDPRTLLVVLTSLIAICCLFHITIETYFIRLSKNLCLRINYEDKKSNFYNKTNENSTEIMKIFENSSNVMMDFSKVNYNSSITNK